MTPLTLLFILSALAQAQDAPPGCSNARIKNGYVVADCVDDVTGNEFEYVDVHHKFKDAFEGASDGGGDVAGNIFASWTSVGGNGTLKRSGPQRRQSEASADSFETAREFISMDGLGAQEEGRAAVGEGLAGGVAVQAGARTNLRSRMACSARHVIDLVKSPNVQKPAKAAASGVMLLGAIATIYSAWAPATADSKNGKNMKRSVCVEIHDGELDDRACLSFAKGEPVYSTPAAADKAIRDCFEGCVAQGKSCQRTWRSKTQQHSCPGWLSWLPWANDKCPVEEHFTNICISDRPNGCTMNYKLNVDCPDPA